MARQFTSWQMSAEMVEFLRLARTSRLRGELVGSIARRHVKIAGSAKVSRAQQSIKILKEEKQMALINKLMVGEFSGRRGQ